MTVTEIPKENTDKIQPVKEAISDLKKEIWTSNIIDQELSLLKQETDKLNIDWLKLYWGRNWALAPTSKEIIQAVSQIQDNNQKSEIKKFIQESAKLYKDWDIVNWSKKIEKLQTFLISKCNCSLYSGIDGKFWLATYRAIANLSKWDNEKLETDLSDIKKTNKKEKLPTIKTIEKTQEIWLTDDDLRAITFQSIWRFDGKWFKFYLLADKRDDNNAIEIADKKYSTWSENCSWLCYQEWVNKDNFLFINFWEYKNGKLNWKWKTLRSDRTIYEWEYRDDKMDGKWKSARFNWDSYEWEFKDDKISGKWYYVWSDGNYYEWKFKDWRMDTNWISSEYKRINDLNIKWAFKNNKKESAIDTDRIKLEK